MKIQVANRELGSLEWELPPLIAGAISAAPLVLQQEALQWLQRQTEGFVLAVIGSVTNDRKRINLEQAMVELVAEVLIDE